jgi:hypothetical protein
MASSELRAYDPEFAGVRMGYAQRVFYLESKTY